MKQLAARWSQLPRRTIRLRLTLLYGGLFLLSGAALLAITYVLVAHQYTGKFFITSFGTTQKVIADGVGVSALPENGDRIAVLTAAGAKAQSNAALHTLLVDCGIALALTSVLSIWLGWLIAGRALAPLRTITNTAREISASNLHRRLALTGPDDELRQLGDTFDGLLARLERAFDAQRQFVANASHELRTPLTYERTVLEVALADRKADAETLRRACEEVLAAGEQQERLIEALLTLSRSQRELERHEPIDLAEVASAALERFDGGLRVDTTLEPAPTTGDPRLAERLVANLMTNATKHNVSGGRVLVSSGTRAGEAVLTVSNTGRVIAESELGRIFEPFQRLDGDRTNGDGLGLGLSIVRAIATAHEGRATARPRPGGGLVVEVAFPAAG